MQSTWWSWDQFLLSVKFLILETKDRALAIGTILFLEKMANYFYFLFLFFAKWQIKAFLGFSSH
jgi:hypothetical protein